MLERCLDRRGQSSRIGCRLVAIGDAEAATEVDRLNRQTLPAEGSDQIGNGGERPPKRRQGENPAADMSGQPNRIPGVVAALAYNATALATGSRTCPSPNRW